MAKRKIYIVHGPEGFLEVRRKLENAKVVVRNYLRDYGFEHELEENLERVRAATASDVHADCVHSGGYFQWEVDEGGGEPGNLYLTVKEV